MILGVSAGQAASEARGSKSGDPACGVDTYELLGLGTIGTFLAAGGAVEFGRDMAMIVGGGRARRTAAKRESMI